MNRFALVGDVGGTNARLALCCLESGRLSAVQSYACQQFASLEAVIRTYLQKVEEQVDSACIAIACPVTDDWVAMTNHSWAFSIRALRQALGLARLEVINDFTAVSMAVPVLPAASLIQLGGQAPQAGRPIAIYGAGTGLGVAHLIQADERWISLPGEGGHVDLAAGSEEEDKVLAVLRAELGHVSAERVLSGPGLVNLYRAVVKAGGREPQALTPQMISERALAEQCSDCQHALTLFCVMMGRFGGNLALNMATFGGVYIAGGIVPRFLAFFRTSPFRQAFEEKGRFQGYLSTIPVYLITHDHPGLLGAGAYLRQLLGQRLSPQG
ncbi:glucokinase [Edwardsiella hoshinae]|nr:glucokinase [Edwardsiella hoshinae]AOV97423.1 glucokinase [Edwardsiella hoshinae]QPR26636.1 glucokinase [Edwardsiella hoshinae]